MNQDYLENPRVFALRPLFIQSPANQRIIRLNAIK